MPATEIIQQIGQGYLQKGTEREGVKHDYRREKTQLMTYNGGMSLTLKCSAEIIWHYNVFKI